MKEPERSTIVEIHSVDEAIPYLEGESPLVLFDVDMVLLQCTDPAFQMHNMVAHSVLDLIEGLTLTQEELLFNLMMIRDDLCLVEVGMPLFTNKLKQKGVQAIALTAALSGSLEHIEDMTAWRFHSLQSFGYDFSYAFPDVKSAHFDSFSFRFGSFPKYDRGVIYTNGIRGNYSKGSVLVAFLEHARCHPKRILFFDDMKINLEHVKEALYEFDSTIEFLGFHYLGGEKVQTQLLPQEDFLQKWEALITEVKNYR